MAKENIELLNGDGLYRTKWEEEIADTSMPDLLCFGTADMDFKTPEPILNALTEVIVKGHLGYPAVPDDFYEIVEQYFRSHSGWRFDARTSMIQNLGVYLSVWNAIDALTKPGDQITILTPCHFIFKKLIQTNGRRLIECPLQYDSRSYSINFERLEACFMAGSRVLWLCNPHNPVGRAWTKDELQRLAELCIRFHVLVFSDDVYFGLVLPGNRYTPLASLSKEISRQTLTFYSTSKTYNTTALRHSFVIAENPVIVQQYRESMERMNTEYGKNIMGMAAVRAAFISCDGWLKNLMEGIRDRRKIMQNYLGEKVPGITMTEADSTYFAWLDLRRLGLPARQLKQLLLEEAHILVDNGADLGKGGEGFIRWNLACSEEHLLDGLERFGAFVQKHHEAT